MSQHMEGVPELPAINKSAIRLLYALVKQYDGKPIYVYDVVPELPDRMTRRAVRLLERYRLVTVTLIGRRSERYYRRESPHLSPTFVGRRMMERLPKQVDSAAAK